MFHRLLPQKCRSAGLRALVCFAILTFAGATAARADIFTNGDFSLGDLTGWTWFVTANGTLGNTYPTVAQIDIDYYSSGGVNDNGPLSVSNAAVFRVGKINSSTPTGGGGIFQNITLPSGQFTLSLDVASVAADGFTGNNDSGTFSLLFDGATVDSQPSQILNGGDQLHFLLSGTVSNVTAGSHEVRLLITRQFTSASTAPLEYADNFQITGQGIPEPSEIALALIGGATLLCRWCRKRSRE